MKARVTGNQPEKVLTFAIDQTLQPLLSETLQKLSIDEYRVPPEACGQSVGYLAGFPGFAESTEAVCAPSCSRGVLCMSGISNARINTLLSALKEKKISIPLKAVVTATNQNWSFAKLIDELMKEHEAIAKKHTNR